MSGQYSKWPVSGGGGGGVTDVTADGGLTSSGGSTPNITIDGVVADNKLSFVNAANATKKISFDISGQTASTTLTIAPLITSNMVLNVPQVATSGGAGMVLTQDETTGFIFGYGITSSLGAANSMFQLANATVANRAQIKLHSYFNGASVSGVSTLTSRSGTIGINNAVVAGQDYSKWTAQACATTVGSAPIAGAWAFKANTVNLLTVTSDYHIQLTNLAGTLGDRLVLGSEGALQLSNYTAGFAVFDASGNITSSAAAITNTYIIDAINGSDTTGFGTYAKPYKTLQKAATLMGSAVSNAEFNDATKSYYYVKLFGSTTEATVTFGTRPNIVLDMSNGVLVGDLIVQFNQGAIFGANNQQPHFTVQGADLRAGYGGLFGYSGINGNLFYESVGSGSSLVAQLHMINTGVTGDIHQRLGTGGGTFTLGEFLTGTMVTGKIICDTAPSAGSTTFYANNSDTSGSRAIGGATGTVQIYQIHNVRFDGAVVVQGTQSGRWFDVQFGAFAHDFTGSSGTTSMDANTYESWQTNVTPQGTVVAALLDTARGVKYTPGTPANWVAPAPTTVQAALDRMAAVVSTGGAVPIP